MTKTESSKEALVVNENGIIVQSHSKKLQTLGENLNLKEKIKANFGVTLT
jgi:hypothetical protein